jgi:arginine-tRNA-protein transferase
VDETPTSLSAVYFYFDPDYERLSPGRVNVLRQIEDAREKGLAFVYLGFRVAGCRSMEYKAQFRPHQLLLNRPGPDEEPEWMAEEKHPLKVRTGGCGK